MYKCQRIKDLILTDYLDDNLDSASKDQLEAHLLLCVSCQDFAKEAKDRLAVPFKKVQREEVPAYVWDKIQEKIQNKEYEGSNALLDLVRRLKEGIFFPKLVPALCSFMMIGLISSNVFLNWQTQQAQDQEQGAYVEYLLSSAAVSSQGDNGDLGTPMEQYFL